MRTDPITDHAAQVIARMRLREEMDRAEARVLREAKTSALPASDRALFFPPFAIVRDYQEA